jgi:hypothetical protein
MQATKIISRAIEAIFAGSVRKFAYKLKFRVFKNIFIDYPGVSRIEKKNILKHTFNF